MATRTRILVFALAALFGSSGLLAQPMVEVGMSFLDNSLNETGFEVETADLGLPDPVWSVALELPAQAGSGDRVGFVLSAQAGTLWGVRSIALNQFGRSGPSNVVELDYRPPLAPGELEQDGPVSVVMRGNLRIEGHLAVAGRITEGGADL